MITRFVLIVEKRHAVAMTGFLILLAALALMFLAPFYGTDSRIHDDRDRRRWWPGTRAE
jgi:hypothetical protein